MVKFAGKVTPLNERRHRWLIVGFVFILASGVAWYWPRSDARFIGKWEVLIYGSDGIAAPSGEVLINRSNGRTTQFINGIEQPEQAHWWVEGSNFVIEPDWPKGFAEVQEIARSDYRKLTGNPVNRPQIRFPIAECSASEISLHAPSESGQRILIRRILE